MTVAELPSFTMRQLLEAGVHFGHQTHRWNPKMDPYIYGPRNNIHVLDLRETVPMLHQALGSVRDVISGGGRLLFVGTKRQASAMVAAAAERCGQYYVNHRWLGGMLTNWKTISNSIRRLRELEEQLSGEEDMGLTKKELLRLTRERDKLDRALGGIKDMGGLPDMLFVIDTVKEDIALKEAIKLGIPVVAIVDSNADPEVVTHPIPGNDDAARAIELYLDLVSRAVLAGLQREQQDAGVDIGESADLVDEIPAAEEPEAETEGETGAATEVVEEASEADAAPEADVAEGETGAATEVVEEASEADAAPEAAVAEGETGAATEVVEEASEADAAPEAAEAEAPAESSEADVAGAAESEPSEATESTETPESTASDESPGKDKPATAD